MPLEKQSLNNFLPNGFETLNQEGYKENFSEDKIATGYEKDVPDIVSGPNLNNLIDVVGKNTNTLNNYVEYLNGMPINNVPTVNKAGQLDYVENSFLNKNQITNCILEAPNGVLTYSGNTITAKQGLKVLIPNGRNTDGTLNNIEYTLENDITKTVTTTYEHQDFIFIKNNGTCFTYGSESIDFYNKLADRPAPATGIYKCCFVAETNLWYVTTNGSSYEELKMAKLGSYFNNASSQITKLNIDEPINLLKQSDKSEISGWGMPSGKFIDLSVGTSGATYIAPANGYYYTRTYGRSFYLGNGRTNAEHQPLNSSSYIGATISVHKGEQISYSYSGGRNDVFRFIYAEGEV